MQPFIEIPVCLDGGKRKDEKTVQGRFRPNEIAGYYPGYEWGAIIIMNSGYTVLTTWSAEQIDSALEAYHETVRKMGGKFAVLQSSTKPGN